jgi:hypothetical protein
MHADHLHEVAHDFSVVLIGQQVQVTVTVADVDDVRKDQLEK